MSNEEKKEEPLVENVPAPGEVSKKTIIMYYGLTVGAVLLVVVIVFIIAVKLGGNPKSEESGDNSLILKYSSPENDKKSKII